MVKVKIANGNYGHNDNGKITVVPIGGTVELADDEAHRLIELGVAELATGRTDDNNSENSVTTVENDGENETSGVNPTLSEKSAEGNSEGEIEKGIALDETQLKSMTNANLKKLAEDMGIDTSKMKIKTDFVKAILDETVYFDNDGEIPPVAAENPIL